MPTRPAASSSSTLAAEAGGPASKRQKLSEHEQDGARSKAEAVDNEDEDDDEEDNEDSDVDHLSAFARPDQLFDRHFVDRLHAAFTGSSSDGKGKARDSLDNATVSKTPFPSLQLRDVFSDELVLSVRKQLVEKTQFNPKENDLYSYSGSGDLSDPAIAPPGSALARLREALYSEAFTNLIAIVTGVQLFPGRPDLSSHRYYDGDHLLAHDDDVRGEEGTEDEGRRIAFILYLVDPAWSREDGGSLDLFECDSLGHPITVKHSIAPLWNSIALFEVSPTSYHTVAEVTLSETLAASKAPYRLSISGWFHGPLASRLALPLSSSIFSGPLALFPSAEHLINPTYLDASTQKTVEQSLINDSSIELRDFLKASVWDKLAEELASTPYDLSSATLVGPAHLRQYHSLKGSPTLDAVVSFFKSSEFLKLLSAFTSLPFVPEETEGRVGGRIFKRGCYTLLHDQGHDPDGVEMVLGLGTKRLQPSTLSSKKASNSKKGKGKANGVTTDEYDADEKAELDELGWTSKWGGQICYCPNKEAEDSEDEEDGKEAGTAKDGLDHNESSNNAVLTILPRPNCLSIIVRNQATVKFVKYVNGKARDQVDGTPLARMDIEGMFVVDIGGEEDEFEGELVEDSEEEDVEESAGGQDEEHEWQGIDKPRSMQSVEPDGPDELDE